MKMIILVGAVRDQNQNGVHYRRYDNLVIEDSMDMSDLNELFDEARVMPSGNDTLDLKEICALVSRGELVFDLDADEEGILVYAPEGTSDDTIELAAYRYYHEQ